MDLNLFMLIIDSYWKQRNIEIIWGLATGEIHGDWQGIETLQKTRAIAAFLRNAAIGPL